MLVQPNIKEKYELGEMIGRGQFGMVFKAFKRKTKEAVCVKVIQKKKEFGLFLETAELDIVRKTMEMNQKNLVKTLEVFDSEMEDKVYMVMELCDCNLNDYMKKTQFTEEEKNHFALNFMKQIVEGYTSLRNAGIIHRELKPDNILIKMEGTKPVFKVIYFQLQIADFGLGKMLDEKQETTTKAIGTPYYQAPEIQMENKDQSYTDNATFFRQQQLRFQFGIIIFEPLVGHNEFNQSLKLLLKGRQFKDVFEKQLINVAQWFKELLNEMMIVHDQKKRISWQNLKLIVDFDLIIKTEIQIGKGVTGDIIEGEIFSSHKKVCCKVIKKGSKYSFVPQKGQNFQNQNIIETLDIFDKGNDNEIIQVMEHCDFNLNSILTKDINILDFMEQIVNGVLTLKSRQFYHCLLTGESILIKQVNDKMIYKLTDFYRKTSQYQETKNSQEQEIAENQLAWRVIELCTKNKCSFDECSTKLQTLNQVGDYKSLVSLLNEILTYHIDWNLILSRLKDIRNEKQKKPFPISQMIMECKQFQQKKQFSTITQPQSNNGYVNNQEGNKLQYSPNKVNFQNYSNKQSNYFQFVPSHLQLKETPQFPEPQFQQQPSQISVPLQQFQSNPPTTQVLPQFQPPLFSQAKNEKFKTINKQNSFKLSPNIGDAPKKEMFENNNTPPPKARPRIFTSPSMSNQQQNTPNQRNIFPNSNLQFYQSGKH